MKPETIDWTKVSPLTTVDTLNAQTARIDGSLIDVSDDTPQAAVNCNTSDVRFMRPMDGIVLFARAMVHCASALFLEPEPKPKKEPEKSEPIIQPVPMMPTWVPQYDDAWSGDKIIDEARRRFNDRDAVFYLLQNRQTIPAIKFCCQQFNWSLTRAKMFCEMIRDGAPWEAARMATESK